MKQGSFKTPGIIVGLLGAMLLLPFILPRTSKVAFENRNLARAIKLAKTCHAYSLDHGGKLPETLSDLDSPEHYGSDARDWDQFRYLDPKSERRMDWLYFPSAKPGDVFIASPIPHKGRRVVVFTDFSGRLVRSEEFEKLMLAVRPGA